MRPHDEKRTDRIEKMAKLAMEKEGFEAHFRQKLIDCEAGPWDDYDFLFDGGNGPCTLFEETCAAGMWAAAACHSCGF